MPHNLAQTDPCPTASEGPARSASDGEEGTGSDKDTAAFGDQAPTRFAADVAYRGTARGRDYVVRVRHRLLETTATVVIDGVGHDPAAEEKALKAAEKGRDGSAETDGAEGEGPVDDLRFRCEKGFTSLRITVLRPDADGVHGDAEQIRVRTAGLGGVGEVEVHRGFGKIMLAPEDGSASAVWEEKRTEHPTRYALLAALSKSARYLIPLLGFGALFSGLLDPVEAWVEQRARPIVEAVAAFLTPLREWLSELTRPARELLSALLRPVADFRAWLMDVLFGWIPDLSLPFSIPDWVVDVALPLLVVLLVFVATFRELRARRERLSAARAARATGGGQAEQSDGAASAAGAAAGTDDADDTADTDGTGDTHGAAGIHDADRPAG